MTTPAAARAETFRALLAPGRFLVLANAWDAGSARVIESCGAQAIATTSAGLAWSHGYPDGEQLPPRALAAAVAEIVRVISIPLSCDFERGFSGDLARIAEHTAALVESGAVGVNIEDGTDSPDVLCAKIETVKKTARSAGVDLFVNARTDVYLKKLAPAERLEAETIARGQRYRAAGADGFFVPTVTDREAIRRIAAAVPLPLNVIVSAGLPPVAELRALGARRLSAGSRLTQRAYRAAREAALELLRDGRHDSLTAPENLVTDMNALLGKERR